MIIEPTVGRIVWYWPYGELRNEQPLAAIVAFVHNTRLVNLAVFDVTGAHPGGLLEVKLRQEGDPVAPGEPHASWMPYQVGQAKKHASVGDAAS